MPWPKVVEQGAGSARRLLHGVVRAHGHLNHHTRRSRGTWLVRVLAK
jgi:hypothetical protein